MAQAIPKDLEAFILTRIDDLFFDVNIFTNEMSKQTAIMMGNGMSGAQIQTIMQQQLATGTGPFGQLQNNTKAKVTETINQSSRKGQETEYSDKDKFAWVTVGGHKVCMDCDGRSGQVRTYGEWEGDGLPGSGWSVCKGYCYCVLDPTGKTGKRVKVDTSKIKPEKGASIAEPKLAPWKKAFSSTNLAMNKAFQDSMKGASARFKTFLTKVPSLQHISSGGGRTSFFHNYSRNWKSIQNYFTKSSPETYFKIHGGINIKTVGVARTKNTIAHEYGHYLHHNLHHGGKSYSEINDMLKAYRASKFNGKPGLFIEDARLYQLGKDWNGLESLLKYDDAVQASRTRLGVPARGKEAQALLKKKHAMMRELEIKAQSNGNLDDWIKKWGETDWTATAKVRGKRGNFRAESVKWKDWLDNIPKNDPYLQAFVKDLEEDTIGYMQDLFGAITKEKIGHGHGVSYYTKSGIQMQHHETFANLTTFYVHENPIYWEFIKREIPELAKYYDDLIEEVLAKGYFGV